jgi:hypothetical protein
MGAEITAVAGLLIAPERGTRIEAIVGIDPDDARFDVPGYAVRELDIARPDG